jgi:polycystin 1L2
VTTIDPNKTCEYDYSPFNEEKGDFDIGWRACHSNITSPPSATWSEIHGAFGYRTSRQLDSLPYAAQYGTYMGGGYVFDMPTRQNVSSVQQQLSMLQDQGWIDESTRAVLVEFTLFNPNVNLFAYCTIAFEYLPVGSIVKSFHFSPITLHTSTSGFMLLALACNLVYVVIISFFALKEIRRLIKAGRKKYFGEAWAYVEWLLIALSFTALAMYMCREHAQSDLFAKLASNSNPRRAQQAIRLQKISHWTDLLLVFVALCSFVGMAKCLKVISFSRNITFLAETFKRCFGQLLNFLVVFSIVWAGFVSLIFAVYNDKTKGCSSFVRTLETTFLIILGKFNTSAFTQSQFIVGAVIFCVFNLCVVWMLANFIIVIITDCFSEAKRDYFALHGHGHSIMMDYFRNKWIDMLTHTFKMRGQEVQSKEGEFKDSIDLFESKTEEFTRHVVEYSEMAKVNYDHIISGKPAAKQSLIRQAKKYKV